MAEATAPYGQKTQKAPAVKEVRRLLDADPGLVNAGNEHGASPLHRAVGHGVHALAALLLERGADVHAGLS